jgi:nucleotide-binding universal stress UspA family protein
VTRRIVHPSDFSKASGAAFKKAVEMAKASHAELMIVNVVNPSAPLVADEHVSPTAYDEVLESTRAWSRKQLDKLLAKAKPAVRAKGFVLEGVAHKEIVRFARSKRADLVVMGTHGRSGLARLFVGSVAGRVVAAAPCPVVTVRGK